MKYKKATDKEADHKKDVESAANVAENKVEISETAGEVSAKEENDVQEDFQQKVNELNDKLLRLYSEFDNYRKRTIREKLEMSKAASEDLITDLLPVLDDFERAIKSIETTNNVDALKEGMQLIFTKFKTILTAKGLQDIPSLGETFNTDHQEAIAHIPAPSEDMKNKVVDELQKGYKLNDKVIRFAKVVVGS